MLNYIKGIIKGPIKKILLWTEKTTPPKKIKFSPESPIKNVHIQKYITLIFVYVSLVLTISFELKLRSIGILGVVIFFAVVMLLVVIYLKKSFNEFINDDSSVILIGVVLIFVVFLSGVLKKYGFSAWAIPTPSVAVLVTLLVSPEIAIISSLVISIFLGFLSGFSIHVCLFSFLGCIVGIFTSAKVKNRYDFIKIGYYIILTNASVLISLWLLEGWDVKLFLSSVLCGVINGIFSIVLSSTFLPYLEKFFSKTTSIRLLELGDFNQPLLRRFMLEAPGSYHHSLMVASLSESAADVVGANPLLCRVGAYYHDVGKIVRPEYFIENQSAILSKHEDLKSQMSSLIIISHVKEGERIMNEYGIGKVVTDIVRQHHGTSLVRYFYMKALEHGITDSDEDVYRYPGPRPKTKESAIVMLADSVEAAARTMAKPSLNRLEQLIRKITQSKLHDGQLDESELTLADLEKIVRAFTQVLASVYHYRIEYPKAEVRPFKRRLVARGNPNRQLSK